MNAKRILLAFVIVLILVVLYGSHQSHDTVVEKSKVIKLPDDFNPHQLYESYNGAHPSTLKRPEESFLFPIKIGETGPVEALFAGPLEYPFLCQTEEARLGQPMVDNYKGEGIKIYKVDESGNKTHELAGYSKDCSLPTKVMYYYKSNKDGGFRILSKHKNDIESINLNGRQVEFIVRVEIGTINRHIYIIYALKGSGEDLQNPVPDNWNRRLIYQFRGGVGIGKRQGKFSVRGLLKRRELQLEKGYAIVHSTANQTSNHYNVWLSEDTALRVKKQFVSQYGEPIYTVGMGGSGGAIQQYLIAQNNKDVLDAALTLYSYPDMLSQTTYVLDCELLEYYFDVIDNKNALWSDWNNRRQIEGMNTSNDHFNSFSLAASAFNLLNFNSLINPMGMSECVNGWRGLTPLILNPHFPQVPDRLSEEVIQQTSLTYWDNLKHIYGTDEKGNAKITWDNVGVQYGLLALKQGAIDVETFLKMNASIGGWKSPQQMQKERFWFFADEYWPGEFSIWSHQNMVMTTDGSVARRHQGDMDAIKAAYYSGHIFMGKLDIPVLDLRHYLDDELDMHHSFSSFSARSRMMYAQGHVDNHVIWMTHKPHTPIPEALDALDQWLMNMRDDTQKDVISARPESLQDTCFDSSGKVVYEGADVWDGDWNQKSVGRCMAYYPAYKNSRMVAGDSIRGNVFKCHLQSVEQAIQKGVYAPVDMRGYSNELKRVFPEGVCDYEQQDAALPRDLIIN